MEDLQLAFKILKESDNLGLASEKLSNERLRLSPCNVLKEKRRTHFMAPQYKPNQDLYFFSKFEDEY